MNTDDYASLDTLTTFDALRRIGAAGENGDAH